MLFCTETFVKFFALVLALYWALPWRQARLVVLLAAGLYFYASWSRGLAALIVTTSALDYLFARGIEASASPRARKALLGLSLGMNLGLLATFKYADFFLASAAAGLRGLGLVSSPPALGLAVPLGMSFYTFEAVSYAADVYRGRCRAERGLGRFLLFITFFPHMIAGPIVRARDFLPQLARPKRWDWMRARLGVELIVLGAFKKLAVADRMAPAADPVFADPAAYGTHAAWLATLAYSVQIYCDFSGYSDIALGCAHLLGYKLAPNFAMPYSSANVGEFWRRWHISLSSWLRDYVYIPLGGNRRGRAVAYRNLLVTMTLGGLWHGASWTFVAWGVAHGLLLAGHRAFAGFCRARPGLDGALRSAPGTALRVGLTFLAVSLCWVMFRTSSFGAAVLVFRRLVVPAGGLAPPLPPTAVWSALALVAAAHAYGRFGDRRPSRSPVPGFARGLGYAAALTLTLLLAPGAGKAFIYFQF